MNTKNALNRKIGKSIFYYRATGVIYRLLANIILANIILEESKDTSFT
jgi:hypothetical protein